MEIKGLSIEQIMDISWSEMRKMSIKELKQLSQRLNSAGNKRLRRLEKSGEAKWSPAYSYIKKSGGDFSVKGKEDKISVMNEIQRASGFLQAKTGNVSGAKRYREKQKEIVDKGIRDINRKDDIYQDITPSQQKKIMKAIESLKVSHGDIIDKLGEETVREELRMHQLQDKRISAKNLAEYFSENESELVREIARKTDDLEMEKMTDAQKKKLYRALDRLREKDASKVHNAGSPVVIAELRRIQLGDKRMSKSRLVEELEKRYPELLESSEATYEREQREIQERTEEDGRFRALTFAEESHNPFRK